MESKIKDACWTGPRSKACLVMEAWWGGDGIQSKCEWMTHDFIWVQIHIRSISARGKWIVNMYLNFNKFVLKLGLVYGGRKVLFWGVLMELSVELSNYIMKLAGKRGRTASSCPLSSPLWQTCVGCKRRGGGGFLLTDLWLNFILFLVT